MVSEGTRSAFEFEPAPPLGPVARGISLWLLPEDGVRERLARLIDVLAERFDTPRFEPHLTLLGGIERPEAEVLAAVRDLAAASFPLVVPVLGLEATDDPFRCLFLRCGLAPELSSLRTAAELALPGRQGRPFEPHVSLLYGELAPSVREALRHEIDPWRSPLRFAALRAHVTRGAVGAWCPLGVAALGSR